MEKIIFEIVDSDENRRVLHNIEGVLLASYEGDEKTKKRIMDEAEKWQLIKKGTYTEEDFVHDVKDSGTYTWIEDSANTVSKNGHFVGFEITFSDVSSYGMSYTNKEEAGLFLTDGRTFGKTERHYSHCSTEKDETTHEIYSIQKKEIKIL